MLETDNRLLNVIVDADNDQTNEQFNIYKDNTQLLAENPAVRFHLDGGNSWINSGRVGIGISNINDAAILHIASTDKGLLIPRMTSTEKNNIGNAVNGLLVFDTDLQRFSYYTSGQWKSLVPNGAFIHENGLVKNNGNDATDDFIFGSDALPGNGNSSDSLMFFDKSKAAFRVGSITNSPNWSLDSIGFGSFATGLNTKAKADNSSAFGNGTKANGINSIAAGQNSEANGINSFAFGDGLLANFNNNFVIGKFNAESTTPFVVGNGTSSERKNVFTINSNGFVGIDLSHNAYYPIHHVSGAHLHEAGIWTNGSDRRLKSNIKPIHYGLAELLKLKPSTYIVNSTKDQHIGFIAQELKEIIPEVVTGFEGDLKNGETLGVSYGNLVALLTKAIQEQQLLIQDLQSKVEQIKLLEARINSLEKRK
jgi:hypothetical protein